MSTRSCIARPNPGQHGEPSQGFTGRYVHYDGYPSGVGWELCRIYREHFQGDFDALQKVLLDDHPAGWSLLRGDWQNVPGFDSPGPQCYCHSSRSETEQVVTDDDASGCGCEYAYVLTRDATGEPVVDIWSAVSHNFNGSAKKMVGTFGSGDPEADWVLVERVGLSAQHDDAWWSALDEKAAHPGGLEPCLYV